MFVAKSKRNQENAGEDAEMQSMNLGTALLQSFVFYNYFIREHFMYCKFPAM